jgi:hypothetical protein
VTPVADIAVVYSEATIRWNRWAGWIDDCGGYSQCLSDAHLQHDILLARSLTPDRLKKYRLVILPSVACLDERTAQVLTEWVRGGGRLLTTGHTGALGSRGLPREELALAEASNLQWKGQCPKSYKTLRLDGRELELERLPFKVALADTARSEVVAEILDRDGNVLAPGLVATRFGTGAVYYDACRLGAYNHMREIARRPQTFDFTLNAPMRDVLLDWVRRAHGAEPPFRAVAIPEKVFASVYREATDSGERLLVHLLNATGSAYAKGDQIRFTTPDEPWPALADDIVFEIDAPAIAEAYAVSPAFEGRRTVATETDDATHRVTLQAQDASWFVTVVLELE